MIYNCELCMYSTDRNFNLKQHFESKKHLSKIQFEKKDTYAKQNITI